MEHRAMLQTENGDFQDKIALLKQELLDTKQALAECQQDFRGVKEKNSQLSRTLNEQQSNMEHVSSLHSSDLGGLEQARLTLALLPQMSSNSSRAETVIEELKRKLHETEHTLEQKEGELNEDEKKVEQHPLPK